MYLCRRLLQGIVKPIELFIPKNSGMKAVLVCAKATVVQQVNLYTTFCEGSTAVVTIGIWLVIRGLPEVLKRPHSGRKSAKRGQITIVWPRIMIVPYR